MAKFCFLNLILRKKKNLKSKSHEYVKPSDLISAYELYMKSPSNYDFNLI